MLTVTPQALSYMTGLNVQNKAGVVTLKYFMSAHFKNLLWWSDNTVTHRPYRNRRANLDRSHQWNRSKAVSHSVTLPLHFKCTHTHIGGEEGEEIQLHTNNWQTEASWKDLWVRSLCMMFSSVTLGTSLGMQRHTETHTDTHTEIHTHRLGRLWTLGGDSEWTTDYTFFSLHPSWSILWEFYHHFNVFLHHCRVITFLRSVNLCANT